MPEISRFYGIIIKMYFDEHLPPHIHVEYGEFEGLININNLALFAGELPPRALGLVTEWGAMHQQELIDFWGKARKLEPLGKITPLN
jgi:hypothetical protein